MVNQLWAIVDIKFGPSPKYGHDLYTITFVGIQDKRLYKTYVNPKHRNYKLWMKYIGTPKKGYVLKGLVSRENDVYTINADHAPKIEITYSNKDEMADELESVWQD